MRDITIGYFKPEKESFISNIVNTNNFLQALSNYVKVLTIIMDFKKIDLRKLEDLDIDYLLVDIKNFGLKQFLLREKHRVNIPFIIILHTVYSWLEPLVYIIPLIRNEDVIIAPSEYTKNSFLRIARKLKVHIIPFCLDIRKIQKNISHNFNTEKKEIGFMGRLTEEKGIGVLIDCMPEIISRTGNAHLNIIGPLSGGRIDDSQESPFVKRLERKVKNLELTNNVHFMGLKLGLDKYRILSESDIFVNPTISEEETFGYVNIEALACGAPVIATNWAGNKELIINGKNGYLVEVINGKKKKPEVNTAQLISSVVNVLKNKKLNIRLRRNAMETAREFDYRKVMPKLVKLLKKGTKIEIKDSWELIKNKRVTDFKHLFNKDFLFFLYYRTHFKNEIYASLYKRIFKPLDLKNQNPLNRKRIKKKNTKDTKIMDKIYRNLLNFLLLRCD